MRLVPVRLLIILLLGAPSLVGAQVASPVAPAASAEGDFAGLVDIGGRSL